MTYKQIKERLLGDKVNWSTHILRNMTSECCGAPCISHSHRTTKKVFGIPQATIECNDVYCLGCIKKCQTRSASGGPISWEEYVARGNGFIELTKGTRYDL